MTSELYPAFEMPCGSCPLAPEKGTPHEGQKVREDVGKARLALIAIDEKREIGDKNFRNHPVEREEIYQQLDVEGATENIIACISRKSQMNCGHYADY